MKPPRKKFARKKTKAKRPKAKKPEEPMSKGFGHLTIPKNAWIRHSGVVHFPDEIEEGE